MAKSLRNFLAALATLILSGGGFSAEVRIYPGGAFHVLGEQDAE